LSSENERLFVTARTVGGRCDRALSRQFFERPLAARPQVTRGVPIETRILGTTTNRCTRKEESKSLEDKAKNKAESATGAAKNVTGRVTDDRSLEAEGKAERGKGGLRRAAEKLKDAFRR
jgi:uncharacterized protein YjbJ (UPF0337 family)